MHSIYMITISKKIYYGYTSRNPLERLKEHLDMAKKGWKHKSLLYPALKAHNYKYRFKVLFKFKTEKEALNKEMELIATLTKAEKLNLTKGGEGKTLGKRRNYKKYKPKRFKSKRGRR